MWHYLVGRETKGPVDEKTMAELAARGVVTPASLVWTRGMDDWVPAAKTSLAEIVALAAPGNAAPGPVHAAAPDPAPRPAAGPRAGTETRKTESGAGFTPGSGYLDASNRAKWTRRFLVMYMAALGLFVSACLAQLNNLEQCMDGDQAAIMDMSRYVEMVSGTALLQMLFFAGAGLLFLFWIYRASGNARALGAWDMQYTPGWSVGWYFIPIMNIWKPYGAMKELWRASASPSAPGSAPVPRLLPWWWGTWLASNVAISISRVILDSAGQGLSTTANLEILNQGMAVLVLGGMLSIASAWLLFRIVGGVDAMQTARAEQPGPA